MRVNLLNVGCFKNLVDSERLMYVLSDSGHDVHFGELTTSADIAIINTCGFIGEAEDESLTVIRRYAKMKHEGKIGLLWIMGCYSQKIGDRLYSLVPEIDMVYDNFNWEQIPVDLGLSMSIGMKRYLTTPSHYAYVKISEGCNQPCSYCIKPILNGPLVSVPINDIIHECKWLVSNGVHEIQLVAQNLTAYGQDIYGKKKIAELVSRISDISGVDWIRLHYGYPVGFPKDLLSVIRERENVCNYLDMAIQHSETKMLKLMRRGLDKEHLCDLIGEIRSAVPNIQLRTTVMVGHPGETEDDFDNLMNFLEVQRFERLGVFRYSSQKGSYAAKHYIDEIDSNIKNARALKIIAFQNKIYSDLAESAIGMVERVIIDNNKENCCIARSQYSTPMADPYIIINNPGLKTGDFYNVRIVAKSGRNSVAEI